MLFKLFKKTCLFLKFLKSLFIANKVAINIIEVNSKIFETKYKKIIKNLIYRAF